MYIRDDVDRLRSSLSPAKQALLGRLLGGRAPEEKAAPAGPVLAARPGGNPPLSFAQQRLWFLDLLSPGSSAYNIPAVVRLTGVLDPAALLWSVESLVRRHETLRTTFLNLGGRPVQVIGPAGRAPLWEVDLGALPDGAREAEAARLAREEARRPFDLARGPLLRLVALRLGPAESLALVTLHHIIADGWSVGVLVRELAALYRAAVRGEPSPLPPLPVQYGDFAHWQREWMQGDELEAQLAYWRGALAGELPVLELPADRPRPLVQAFRGRRHPIHVPAPLVRALRELSRREGCTLFMTLLAGFATLLHRHGGAGEILIGTPVANRRRPELEPLIGVFVNTLVLRVGLTAAASFRELLARVRQVALGAFAHQDLPFERLVEELQPGRNLSHSPLFQVMFVFDNAPMGRIDLPGLTVRLEGTDTGATQFDWTLTLLETEEGLTGALVYDTDLFQDTMIARAAGHLEALLEGCAALPELPLWNLPMMPESERHQMLREWNDTRTPGPGECAHQLFERQAALRPDDVAAVCGDEEMTYRELDGRAARLAGRLRAHGVGPEARVALFAERGLDLLVAVLGILKAGGAYVPLDPQHPRERLAWIVEDCGAPVLLTQRRLLASAPARRAQVLLLEDDGPPGAAPGPAGAVADNLAYVIYTSGSTGRPKGVQVTHRGVVSFLRSMAAAPGLSADDRLLAVTTLAFDISVLELLLPLAVGGRVVIAEGETVVDGAALAQALARHRITALQATPAGWRLLLQSGWEPGGPFKALCGGEALPGRLAEALTGALGSLWNLYGPTETTVWSAVRRLGSTPGPVPIGRPIANTRIHLLDAGLRLVPLGTPGELCIGGEGVSRGYWNRPDLTAERFVPDPFDGAGERLYRTGDLARRRPDGELEFLGRLDHQVKVRGFRIELGEIEACLARRTEVRQAAVVVREDSPGDQRLAAYLVPAGEERPEPAALRESLRQSLPDYMIPSTFVWLAALPLTPNGKLDRAALPAPGALGGGEEAHEPPRNPVEEVLAGMWADVLGAGRVGVRDSFFELGGHSLLGVQLLENVRRAFGLDLPLRTLFEAPTVAAMASRIAEARGLELRESLVLPRIEPDLPGRHEPFPLTDVQQAYWIGRSGAMDLGNVSCHVYTEHELDGLDLERFELAWNRLVDRHDMLRAVILPDGRQRILPEVPPYEIRALDLRGLSADSREEALQGVRAEMSHQVLPSDHWPLFDLRACWLTDGTTRLHVGFDLLIGDAWSFQILMRELLDLYAADGTAPLPPLDLSFRDCVLAGIAIEESDLYRRARDYWRARLDTLPPPPGLPLAQNPEAAANPRFERRSLDLDAAVWSAIKRRAARAGLTPSGALLAAFAEVLATWSRGPRFSLVLTLFNRMPLHPQVDRIVGDFTSLTLLEVDASPGGTFEERARRLQARLWEDLDHRHFSSVRVMRELIQSRGWGSHAAVPVVFTSTLDLQPGGGRERPSSGLEARPVFGISQTPQVLLDHQVSELDGALSFAWDAVGGLFPPGLLDDMFSAYCGFLARLAGEEAWTGERASLLPAGQLALRARVNATEAPVLDALLHEGFFEQARRAPERVALVAAGRTLTYGELGRLATRMGRRLRELGARPNTLVAVVAEKGWEQVASVLGVLASGAAYLPVDPALPAERVAFLLEHGQVRLALTQEHLDERLEWPAAVRRIRVDAEDWDAVDDRPLDAVQGAGDLAYVIFTSGSTGLPKGVMIDHRGASNTVADVNRSFAVGPEDRALALSSLSFDLSVYDIFGLLAAGGTVVVPDEARRREPAHWLELIEREGVTLWNSVPALLQMLVDYLSGRPGAPLGPLRLVLLSGDWIPVPLPNRVRELAGEVELVSLGGATEASIWSISHPIGEVDPQWKSIPYGRPMANQTFHVLDSGLDPCPVWVPGELFIGGIGLAQGYWRDPQKTRASFFAHPRTGERLYRAGDLGRYLPGGDIEFLGREDFQVKVQGHRIELGEIEAALLQHREVREAVVTVHEGAGQKRLVGYVVPEREAVLDPEEIRRFLGCKLPSHMVPPVLTVLERFPLTPNGKVDRRALPAPGVEEARDAARRGPLNPVEEALAAVCEEIFGRRPPGLEVSFFDLGGTSMSAALLISRVRDALGVELPLRSVFEAASLADLAGAVLLRQAEQADGQEMAAMLSELESLSPEELERLLDEEGT